MHELYAEQRRYLQFDRLRAAPELVHAYSTRPLDVSLRRDESSERRTANRRQMAADLGLEPGRLTLCGQVHEPRIGIVGEHDPPGVRAGHDALVTAAPGVPLMAFSADCPLLVLYEPVRRLLAVVHASWRCTVAQLARRTLDRLVDEFGGDATRVRAGIGPGAGPCCYEVGEDVYEAAHALPRHDTLFAQRDGRLYFDLPRANEALLTAGGVPASNIAHAELCTMCRTDLFYSYRREKAGCGHFGLMAALRNGLPACGSGKNRT